MAGTVSDKDKGLTALLKRVKEGGKGLSLTIGIHSAEGSAPDGGGSLSVSEVATLNEFGGSNNRPPPRPFIRGWADANEAENKDMLASVAQAVTKGKLTPEQGLERLGLKFVAGVQAFIVAGVPPANAPSTVAQKGSSTPLVDTGQMKSAIRHKVTAEGG